ncbi:MAG: LPS assembly lipoprotein LptE [bacterium]|nr:LPS assembly lipoprotein LptE [bacterium]
MKILSIVLWFLVILLGGCIYSFKGFTAEKAYDIYVENFENTSEKAGIEIDFTRWVTENFDSDLRFNVVSKANSEYTVKFTISGYKVEPYQYNPDGTVLSYRIIVMGYLRIARTKEGKVMLEDKLVSAWGTYAYSEREEDGLKRVSEDLGMKIIQEFLSSVSQ